MKARLLILLVLLGGCSLEKKIYWTHKFIEKHPEVLDPYIDTTTIFTDSVHIVYDTAHVTITDTLSIAMNVSDTGELHSVIDSSKPVNPWTMVSDTTYVETKFARARSWVDHYKIITVLDQDEVVAKFEYDSVRKEVEHWQNEYTSAILQKPPEKIIPKWVYLESGALLLSFLLNVILVVTLIRRLRLK